MERLKNTNLEAERYVRPPSPILRRSESGSVSKRVHYSDTLTQEYDGRRGQGRRGRRRFEEEEREKRVHYADTHTYSHYRRWPHLTEDEDYNA